VPFTDPLADGPTIQRAAERALEAGVTLRKVIGLVRQLRQETQVPLVLMTYYNPVFKYGVEGFVRDAVDAGVDGLIIPDLPPDEAGDLMGCTDHDALAIIFLLAPTSTPQRIKKIAHVSRGFIYYVSMTGITGSRLALDASLQTSMESVRRTTRKPVAVGFGISTPEEAGTVARFADGVIVGSAIVRRLHESPESIEDFLSELRRAI
jgi:tryptophan synthase alpha chain